MSIEFALFAGIALLLGVAAALSKWRWGVVLGFGWLYLEDIVRRLLPGQPFEVTFIKEAIIIPTYFSFFAAMALRPRMTQVFQRLRFIPAFSLLIMVSLLSPAYTLSPSLWTAALGVRSYFWYVPFSLMGYFMFRSEIEFRQFARLLAYTSIPITLFAVFQLVFYGKIDFSLMRPYNTSDPVHSFLNTYIPFITSIFGSHGRYARFSLLLFFLTLALLIPPLEQKRNQRVLVGCLILSAVGVFLSGQRTSMYLLVLGFGCFVLLMGIVYGHFKLNRKLLRILLTGIGSVMAIVLVIFVWFPDLGDYFLHFASVLERFTEFLPADVGVALHKTGINGMGFGNASQGIQYVAKFTALQEEVGVESGIGKVWYEMGFPGMSAFALFCISLIYYAARRFKQYPRISRKSLAAAIALYFGSVLFDFLFLHHQALGDATTIIPLWFFVGVMFGMERWEK